MIVLDNLLDKAIVAEYKDFIMRHEVAADGIVADPDLAMEFTGGVARRSGIFNLDVKVVNLRLLNLRRRGENNGGLPRSQRDYKGRNKAR